MPHLDRRLVIPTNCGPTGKDGFAKFRMSKMRIAGIAILASSLIACGPSDDPSSAMELALTSDTAALFHFTGPSGRTETPMKISAGTIVQGKKSDLGKDGTCTVRWTDMEKREALGGTESRELFLDLPCANLAAAKTTARPERVAYDKMIPFASSPDVEPVTIPLPDNLNMVALSAPVWACSSEKEYRQALGNEGADCVVVRANTRVTFVNPNADENSPYYKIKLRVGGKDGTYVVHKSDLLPIPYHPSQSGQDGECSTIPKTTCIGNEG